jgi:hypothetical protein
VEKQYAIEKSLEEKTKVKDAIAEEMSLVLIEETKLNF